MFEGSSFSPAKTNNSNNNRSKGNIFFQPKLSLNQPDDVFEREANAVADSVVHNGHAAIHSFFSPSSVQPKMNDDQSSAATGNYIGRLPGGHPLSHDEKTFFGERMGYDFSDVRIHTDNNARQSANNIHALAYTSGRNIVFGSGQYQPGTKTGSWLMAHELTHVVQQKNSPASRHIARATPGTASSKKEDPVGEKFEDTFVMKELVEEPAIMGKEYTADCETHRLTFKFPKAFKAIIPGSVPGFDFKGVYVNIEAHYANKTQSGTCATLKLLQVLRYFRMDNEGVPVTSEPTSAINKTRAGIGTDQASIGWFVDTGEANPDPFYASSGWGTEGKEGSENTPAALWDIPASLPAKSHGKEFYTCAVCENEFDKTRSFAGCIKWGYVIDNNLTVKFYPADPVASCTIPAEVIDASKRWDLLQGINKTGITY